MAQAPKGLRLDLDVQERLEALGRKRDRTPHYLMKVAVERFLEEEEAVEAERDEMRRRWERFAVTGEAVDHGDVRAWAARLTDRAGRDAD